MLVLMLPVGVFYLVTGEFLAHLEDPATPLPLLAPYLALIVAVLAVVFATQVLAVPRHLQRRCTRKARASASAWPSG